MRILGKSIISSDEAIVGDEIFIDYQQKLHSPFEKQREAELYGIMRGVERCRTV